MGEQNKKFNLKNHTAGLGIPKSMFIVRILCALGILFVDEKLKKKNKGENECTFMYVGSP